MPSKLGGLPWANAVRPYGKRAVQFVKNPAVLFTFHRFYGIIQLIDKLEFDEVIVMTENYLIITIKKVEKDTETAVALLEFVKNFSWNEVKEHTVRVIKNWEFEEWETPFVAMANGSIVGIVTIMKSDYYPLPDIYPWVSTLFVSEEYRGHRISKKLIDFANDYAKGIGFDRTYIPSEHMGLYEKYGYSYIKDIINYSGATDHLYAKKLR